MLFVFAFRFTFFLFSFWLFSEIVRQETLIISIKSSLQARETFAFVPGRQRSIESCGCSTPHTSSLLLFPLSSRMTASFAMRNFTFMALLISHLYLITITCLVHYDTWAGGGNRRKRRKASDDRTVREGKNLRKYHRAGGLKVDIDNDINAKIINVVAGLASSWGKDFLLFKENSQLDWARPKVASELLQASYHASHHEVAKVHQALKLNFHPKTRLNFLTIPQTKPRERRATTSRRRKIRSHHG